MSKHRSIDAIRPAQSKRRLARRVLVGIVAMATVAATVAAMPAAQAAVPFPIASLDGGGNNVANPTWGQSNRPYVRVAPAVYADNIGAPQTGPNARYISNRIFGDSNQNVFSERRVTQWGWTWGQFLDHTFGLRAETGSTATTFDIPFSPSDPLETFSNTLGVIPLTRTNATPGTGTSAANPRQQDNTTSSLINAFSVYGGTNARLDWLRNGSQDGNPANNSATLLLPNGFLPRRDARGNPANAPTMAIDGQLLANPNAAMVAGDVRANELQLWLRPAADPQAVQAGIRAEARRLTPSPAALDIASAADLRAISLRIFDRSFAVTYWLQAVAIAIGLFGVAASFSAQVLARRKEFGLLAHLGLTRRQVLAVVAGEGAAWTLIGAACGLLLGLAVAVLLVHVVNPQSFHWTMDLLLPWGRLLALCAAVVLAGTLTAWVAGRAAAGRDAVLAVKEDW